ncbi:MAG: Na+-dependent transporter [Polyangiaceae bacterium]|nr:Na+-dependent transporter [Polyangiaceae bacterium]
MKALLHAIHSNLLWILLGTYALASLVPGPGLALRSPTLGAVAIGGGRLELGVPTMLLALLLFNASLGANARELRTLIRKPKVLGVGLAANIVLPLVFTVAASVALGSWHNEDELQSLLVGLALVASMPIAGSSTAWSQNADGNLALSLGLVLASTLVSPIATPLALHTIGNVTSGDYAEDLHELAGGGAQLFLAVAVIAPTLLGMGIHALVGKHRIAKVMPSIKLLNIAVLLLLNYSNASVSLPQLIRKPDWDLLLLVFAVASVLCGLAFYAGHVVAKATKASPHERVALIFGLGMTNNGSGLVLATTVLTDHPNVLLTIVAYNLVQQIAAGVFDHVSLQRHTRTRTGGGLRTEAASHA